MIEKKIDKYLKESTGIKGYKIVKPQPRCSTCKFGQFDIGPGAGDFHYCRNPENGSGQADARNPDVLWIDFDGWCPKYRKMK